MAVKVYKTMHSSYLPHDPVDTDVGDVSLTYQEFAKDCDINEIMRRFELSGDFGPNGMPRNREPMYLDLSWVPDNLQDTLSFLADAEEAFMNLPAAVRRECDNDPEKFVQFATDPKNLDRMREWGLAPPKPVEVAPTPSPAPPAAPAAGGSQAA